MKFSIQWHEQTVANATKTLAKDQELLEQLARDIERYKADIAFTERQIAEAKRRGLKEFDPERFLRKRGT